MGKTSHPTIVKFWSERAWHEQLGVAVDPRPLADRPWREVREYELIMRAEAEAHNEKQNQKR